MGYFKSTLCLDSYLANMSNAQVVVAFQRVTQFGFGLWLLARWSSTRSSAGRREPRPWV